MATAGPPRPQFRPPSLWELPAAVFATQLLAGKTHCTTMELRQHALMTIARVADPDNAAVYFTEGLVDQDRGGTGNVAITIRIKLVVSTPDLQPADQVGCHPVIPGARPPSLGGRPTWCLIHTDSMTGLLVLQQPHPGDDVGVVSAILDSL
ncbi:hypothetical protein E2C01_046193 [Portunus trituberculatus]|uniref:Uncharacterized protein n=1 Tax=Portunus trituberculatus TaxID=210409 RepID=A0A5B7G452_PORTR|nr:hypothetical protein [Portunus trituberculatus]